MRKYGTRLCDNPEFMEKDKEIRKFHPGPSQTSDHRKAA